MLLSGLAALAILQDDSLPKQRVELSNGTRIFAERRADWDSVTFCLFAAAGASADTPTTQGWRHLVEHLCVKGLDGKLDRRLERAGVLLTAETSRDGMTITVSGPADQAPLCLQALRECLAPLAVTAEQIASEVRIMRQELALRTPGAHLVSAAWKGFFDERGLDPSGNLETMAKATPESLAAIHERQFAPGQLAIVVVGSIPVESTVRMVSETFAARPAVETEPMTRDGEDAPGRVESEAVGEGRSVLVDGISETRTLSVLAAGMGLGQVIPGARLSYVPSGLTACATLTTMARGDFEPADRLDSAGKALAAIRGRAALAAWVRSELSRPTRYAQWRATCLRQMPGFDPSELPGRIERLTTTQLQGGLDSWRRESCLQVVGT